MKNELTIEQSAKLIERGIPKEKASKMWVKSSIGGYTFEKNNLLLEALMWRKENVGDTEDYGFIFTLADLFSLIPKTIPDEDNKPNGYHRFGIAVDHKMQWCVSFFGNCYRHIGFDNEELIGSLYQMVKWLAENKLIELTNKKISDDTDPD